jgi:hypothetical protein
MKKLMLAIEDLQVETFDPHPADSIGRGTVFGRESFRTLYDGWPCDLPTNSPLQFGCDQTDAVVGVDGGVGNCTNVCPSGPLACETVEEWECTVNCAT